MPHIRHSAVGQIIRHRRKNALQSALCSLLILSAVALAALCTPLMQLNEETACHFQGVVYTEPSQTQEQLPPTQPPRQHAVSAPELQLPDTPLIPGEKSGIPLTELHELEPEPEDGYFLEIIPEVQIPAARHTASNTPRNEAPRKGADEFTPPAYRRCPHPPYPPALRRQREERTVGVLIQVATDGSPAEVSITRPSGISSLDQHTRNWILKNWHFVPARKNGGPTSASVSISIHYTLTS